MKAGRHDLESVALQVGFGSRATLRRALQRGT